MWLNVIQIDNYVMIDLAMCNWRYENGFLKNQLHLNIFAWFTKWFYK